MTAMKPGPACRVQILCPGILGPVPELPAALQGLATLARTLARADLLPEVAVDPLVALLRLQGQHAEPESDPPTAACCLLGEGVAAAADGYWMHADPVHLRPDRDRLRLFAGAAVAPDRIEADALVAACNRHLAGQGLVLIAPTPGHWYLRAAEPPSLLQCPLHQVWGRGLEAALPQGADARRWMQLHTEVQMLFFEHPVNRRREQAGRPLINGVWTWGGGALPVPAADPPALHVGDHPLVRGLAAQARTPWSTWEAWTADPLECPGRVLVYWDAAAQALQAEDLDAWLSALAALDTRLLALSDALRRGVLEAIELHPGAGVAYRLTLRGWRRFWRRRTLTRFVSNTAGRR